jgi:hypothetical protein
MRFDVCSFLLCARFVYYDKPLVANLQHSLTKGDRELSADPMSMTSSPS